MKMLAAWILAIALVFRAAPLCAAPVVAEAAAAMPDCEDAMTGHHEEQETQGRDAALACHSCVFPPATNAIVTDSVQWVGSVPRPQPATQFEGPALEPPVPPPRFAAFTINSIF